MQEKIVIIVIRKIREIKLKLFLYFEKIFFI